MCCRILFKLVRKVLSYCLKCGAKLKEDDKFCYVCGTPVAKVVREEFAVSADNLIEKVRELLHEGNVTRIIVKDEKDKVLLEIPATVGVIGAVLVPWLAALGVIAALVTNCRIVVERRE
jgi:CBS domain-containing protein